VLLVVDVTFVDDDDDGDDDGDVDVDANEDGESPVVTLLLLLLLKGILTIGKLQVIRPTKSRLLVSF